SFRLMENHKERTATYAASITRENVKSSGDTAENPPTTWRAGIIRNPALCMRSYIEDPLMPHTVESVLRNPTVRVEFEQAIAIGGVGECLAATKTKNWGAGSSVLPLEVGDWF